MCDCQEDKERKKCDQLERRKESQRLADEEMSSLKSSSSAAAAGSVGVHKVTRADIEARMQQSAAATTAVSNTVVIDELPIEENLNRMTVDGLEARSVDEAIKLLR